VADLFLIPECDGCKGTKGAINKLGRIQRQVSLRIMGAMKSAPTDVIDTCADLLPFPLLINKIVHCAAMRLAMLTSPHPLMKHVARATKRNVKRHRAPLHEVVHTYNICPAGIEDIYPVRFKPKWRPQFDIQVPMSRSEAIEAAGMAQADVKAYSDAQG